MAAENEATAKDWRKTPTGTGHIQRAVHIFKTGLWSDVKLFVSKEKKSYAVHKLILRAGSKVFDDLFKQDESKEEFQIANLEIDEFLYMLNYLYAGWFPETVNEALGVLNAASQYELGNLAQICAEVLRKFLDETNALRIYQAALKFGEVDMAECAMKVICRFGNKIIKFKEFLEVSNVELSNILARDDLQIPDEAKLFDTMMDWGKAECERQNTIVTHKYLRSMLENIIPLIRFPQMDPTDFGLKVVPTNILLTEEVTSVLVYFGVRQSQRSAVDTGVFNSQPRAAYVPSGKIYLIPRLEKAAATRVMDFSTNSVTKHTYIPAIPGLEHSIRLKSSRPIWITSIGMNSASLSANKKDVRSIVKVPGMMSKDNTHYENDYFYYWDLGPEEKPSACRRHELSVKIELKDDEKKVLASRIQLMGGAPISRLNHVRLTNPVPIRPDEWYSASITVMSGIVNVDNYTAVDGIGTSLDKVTLIDGIKTVVKFQFRNDDNPKYTSVTQGFIPEIGFMVE